MRTGLYLMLCRSRTCPAAPSAAAKQRLTLLGAHIPGLCTLSVSALQALRVPEDAIPARQLGESSPGEKDLVVSV